MCSHRIVELTPPLYPRQPAPEPDNPCHEEIFPTIQPTPPWHNLRPFILVLSLVIWEQRPPPTLFQGVVESDKVPQSLCFFQDKQPHLLKLLPLRLGLQTLDSYSYLCDFLYHGHTAVRQLNYSFYQKRCVLGK